MKSPRDVALGYHYQCPYCLHWMCEGKQTGIYYGGTAVCDECAPILQQVRAAEASKQSPASVRIDAIYGANLMLECGCCIGQHPDRISFSPCAIHQSKWDAIQRHMESLSLKPR